MCSFCSEVFVRLGAESVNARRHATVTNCVRLFKFLIPEYGLDFTDRLHKYAEQEDDRIMPPSAAAYLRMSHLQDLYGCDVIPNSMLELCRRPIGAGKVSQLADVLCSLLLRSEEKPVVTRFLAVQAMHRSPVSVDLIWDSCGANLEDSCSV